jgi:hypothetical protein
MILLFSAAFTCLDIALAKQNNHQVLAYERHEFVFIEGLNLSALGNQQRADATCRANFQDIRQQGIFNSEVERNTWHVWAHVQNGHCVMNVRNLAGFGVADWRPSNNRARRIRVRVPRF